MKIHIKENLTKVWTGSHKGVDFEIKNYTSGEMNWWVYYLYIHLDRIPAKYNPQSYWLKGKKDSFGNISYSYYKHPVLPYLDWHYGITYYNKERGFDGEAKVIKVGCDYNHLWDEGVEYDIEDITLDVENAIESFLTQVPDYKLWCCGNGKLYNTNQGILKDGRFYSRSYFGKQDWWKDEFKKGKNK